ncbi:LysR family transcriptional regulator [Gemmobacter aquaticus]|uniref:LysR family transcriptional regulator n=1 Tax=Gemmobacter aquaticus TaxID=490185 RepID=A0A918DCS3_9RHOB|nr:LysR family transcriptional regulator [Gemmobacter aquaticus]GGO33077.1 LysR family transcriptional regulator [Gemmobacter aquaticus]
MKLNQRQIEVFHAVMQNKSITAAAARLGSSQPTLSRELREIENRLGFDLFLRFGRRLTPTEQALMLHDVVLRSFIGLDEISRAAAAIRSRNAASFRVACIPAHADSIIPRVIQRVQGQRPAINFSIHSQEESALRHEMTTQVFDLCLAENLLDPDAAGSEVIVTGNMVCALPQGHPLTARAVLRPEDFAGQPNIFFNQNDPYRHKLDAVFHEADVTRTYAGETTTAASVCAMVAAGLGIAIINPLTAASQCGGPVVFRRFSVALPYQLALWSPVRSTRQAPIRRFIAALHETASVMAAELESHLAQPMSWRAAEDVGGAERLSSGATGCV